MVSSECRKKKSSWKIFSWLYCPAVVTREGEKSKPVWNLIPFCSSFIYYLPCSARVWGAPRARLSDKHDMNLPYANPAAHFPYGQRYHISLLSRLHIRIRPSRPNSSYCIHVQSNATNPESWKKEKPGGKTERYENVCAYHSCLAESVQVKKRGQDKERKHKELGYLIIGIILTRASGGIYKKAY